MPLERIALLISTCATCFSASPENVPLSYLQNSRVHPSASTSVRSVIDISAVDRANKDSARDKKIYAFQSRLEEYRHLNPGWDGELGTCPEIEHVNNLSTLLEIVVRENLPVPDPAISSEGEVGLYWRKDGFFVEITIDDPGIYSYIAYTNEGAKVYGEGLSVDEGIDDGILELISKAFGSSTLIKGRYISKNATEVKGYTSPLKDEAVSYLTRFSRGSSDTRANWAVAT